jgi:hypothetical protein
MTRTLALRMTIGAMLLVPAAIARAQDSVPRQMWRVDGVVELGLREAPKPVANQWVVVHRIASDANGKVSGNALDSSRTDARGHYDIRFPHYGSADATYIAITTYSGVSYISVPLTRPRITGDDATIMVFDTTAPPYPIRVAGRHLVVTSPDSGDRRRVIEVYELMNDSTLTVMGSETNPVWKAPIPPGVTDVTINPAGDVSPSMAKVIPDWLQVFAPISPGIRQLSFTYTLGADAFPLVMPVVDSASVFELLVQEQGAFIEGGGFTEVAGVMQEGVPFRRFLAQNVPVNAVMRISVPKPVSRLGRKGVSIIAWSILAMLVLALGFIFWRRRATTGPSRGSAPVNTVESLTREIAMLDAAFEARAEATAAEQQEFSTRREELKARLSAALADPAMHG